MLFVFCVWIWIHIWRHSSSYGRNYFSISCMAGLLATISLSVCLCSKVFPFIFVRLLSRCKNRGLQFCFVFSLFVCFLFFVFLLTTLNTHMLSHCLLAFIFKFFAEKSAVSLANFFLPVQIHCSNSHELFQFTFQLCNFHLNILNNLYLFNNICYLIYYPYTFLYFLIMLSLCSMNIFIKAILKYFSVKSDVFSLTGDSVSPTPHYPRIFEDILCYIFVYAIIKLLEPRCFR